MAYDVPKPRGYWTVERTVVELRGVVRMIGHFPTQVELKKLNRVDLHGAIMRLGGFYKFRSLLGYDTARKPAYFWTYANTLNELQALIARLGHFPTDSELSAMKRTDLSNAIRKHGGINKFRGLLGYEPLRKSRGYWTDEMIIIKLREIINKIGHFPTHVELSKMALTGLSNAIIDHGGTEKFQKLLGYEPPQREVFWTLENTVEELRKFINQLGHFPTMREFIEFNRVDLYGGVIRNGGTNKFRRLLGYTLIQHSKGDWTDEVIANDLKAVADKLGHFPSEKELVILGKYDLVGALCRHGGMKKFREMSGFPMSLHEKHRSELSSYINNRGRGSEKVVQVVLIDWCNKHNLPLPTYNNKLAPKNVIEFVCNLNKKIGIDVTNTKSKETIRRKWTRKDYYKYLDELWIVVFSTAFSDGDYYGLNDESPDNVKIMSIDEFLVEMGVPVNNRLMNKITDYKNCTLSTKDELKQKYRSG